MILHVAPDRLDTWSETFSFGMHWHVHLHSAKTMLPWLAIHIVSSENYFKLAVGELTLYWGVRSGKQRDENICYLQH